MQVVVGGRAASVKSGGGGSPQRIRPVPGDGRRTRPTSLTRAAAGVLRRANGISFGMPVVSARARDAAADGVVR